MKKRMFDDSEEEHITEEGNNFCRDFEKLISEFISKKHDEGYSIHDIVSLAEITVRDVALNIQFKIRYK